MNIKQKILNRTFLGGMLVLISMLSSVALFSAPANAWCGGEVSTKCIEENFYGLPDTGNGLRRGFDLDKYRKSIDDCKGKNSVLGMGGADEGTCADAVYTCLKRSIEASVCSDGETLAQMTGRFTCNQGKAEGDNGFCAPIEDKNKEYFDNKNKELTKAAEDSCTISGGAESTKQRDACRATAQRVIDGCKKENNVDISENWAKRNYNEYNQDAYQACINKGLTEGAKDQAECTKRGGVWDATVGPVVGSRCAAPKTAGSKTCDDGSAPGADGKCADGSTPGKKTAEQPNGSYKGTQTQNCGKAQTNILSCDKDSSGSEVIGYILKAILMIMSVGVGILAVGGIVYGAILYSSAQDNAAQTKKAIEVIINTVIGLLLYIFMYSILNWLVPGGVFL